TRAATLEIVSGDIARLPAHTIVNAWNRNVVPGFMLIPQGVSAALGRAGGRSSLREVVRRPPIPLGGAIETTAGDLPARWIIHVAGLHLLWFASRRSVRHSVCTVLRLARWLGATEVSMPLIGSGTGGLDERTVLEILMSECEARRTQLDKVRIVVRS